jgi:hypothetical protein
MITTLGKTEYYLLNDLISRWLDDNSLLENFRRQRDKNDAFRAIVASHFSDDLSLLTSFIISNSNVVYDVEVTQQSVVKTKYFHYFNRPVTEEDVVKEFNKNQGVFEVYDRWYEYSDDEPECSIEALRMVVPFEKLLYPNSTVCSVSLLEANSGNHLKQQPCGLVPSQSFTANTEHISI